MTVLAANEEQWSDRWQHPAVRAWSRLQPGRDVSEIRPLKRTAKSAIYRLTNTAAEARGVIAKRCLTATGLIERIVYEEILPRVAAPGLRFFGFLEDADPQFCWLFLEDAGSEAYAPALDSHRAAAARWLALLHTSAAGLPGAHRLPGRSPAYYLERLRLARANVIKCLANPALKPAEAAIVEASRGRFDLLESRWAQIEEYCDGVAPTFMHGDFKEKNVRVNHTPQGITLLVFDWEIAGWGVPAVDLWKCPDMPAYWRTAREHWPNLALADLERVARVGAIFRNLIAMHWKSLALSYEWVEWPVKKLELYLNRLEAATASLG